MPNKKVGNILQEQHTEKSYFPRRILKNTDACQVHRFNIGEEDFVVWLITILKVVLKSLFSDALKKFIFMSDVVKFVLILIQVLRNQIAFSIFLQKLQIFQKML